MAQDMLRTVELLNQLWNEGNSELATQIYKEDAERCDPNRPEPARGAQQIVDRVAEVRRGFPDFRLDIDRRFAQEDHLAVHWTATGTHLGQFEGIPPTGKRVVISGMTLARFSAGQIAEERVYFDRLTLLEQLGVAPVAAQAASSS